MINAYLRSQAQARSARFLDGVQTLDDWLERREALKREYLYMLGLWPMPGRTDLHATVTGTLERDGYVVERVHYQSRPRLYVTGNVYRPARIAPGRKCPAVLYLVGHTRWGKAAYQSHGIWFAKHGYVCLVLDTLGQGEIPGLHAGTYRGKRGWWSRGYTPAGVECWNGVRGIDYLVSRNDVDPDRIAVTGFSGGGAATLWVAAADERVKAVVVVSGIADLSAYVSDRYVNVHCDCMFLHNAFGWPWVRIPALIAPRPLLVINGTEDRFFPLDAHQRIMSRLERVYALFGAGDMVDSVVSVGPHGYRPDVRRAAYRFINLHLKGDPSVVTDSEADLLREEGGRPVAPIPASALRVFQDGLPADALNPVIDEHFVPVTEVAVPEAGRFTRWRKDLLAELRRVTFRTLPDSIEPARLLDEEQGGRWCLSGEEGIRFYVTRLSPQVDEEKVQRVVMIVADPETPAEADVPAWAWAWVRPGDAVFLCEPRGVGPTQWSDEVPPNYVARALVLVGQTADAGRVRDIASAADFLSARLQPAEGVLVMGRAYGAVLAGYAALWEPRIASAVLVAPYATHRDPRAPEFLNVLRVCDIPDVLGMLAPRSLVLAGCSHQVAEKVRAIYKAADAEERLIITGDLQGEK